MIKKKNSIFHIIYIIMSIHIFYTIFKYIIYNKNKLRNNACVIIIIQKFILYFYGQ